MLSGAQTTPFEIRDEINVNENLRLKYRYLDLRRPSMHAPIVLRSKIAKIIRDYYEENAFVEIETPMLMKSTPRGRARLPGAQPGAAGAFLCAAAVSAAV